MDGLLMEATLVNQDRKAMWLKGELYRVAFIVFTEVMCAVARCVASPVQQVRE